MSDLEIAVLRPVDLLSLKITCTNLRIANESGQPAHLLRVEPALPALLIFELPPQHVGERCFAEDGLTGELLHISSPPFPTALADPSRVVFRLPAAMQSIALTIDDLLRWTDYELVVAPNAQPDPPTTMDRPQPASPTPQQTALEVPFGLVLSPDASAGWGHSSAAVTRNGRTELWHTRLGVKSAGRVDEARKPALRAVANLHQGTLLASFFSSEMGEPLAASRRECIVHATSDFSLNVQQAIMDSSGFPVPVTSPYVPIPVRTRRLMLSPLGAWADLGVDLPTNSDDPAAPIFPDAVIGIAAWRHIVSMGRDQYVRIVTKGFLLPFGIPAAFTQTTQRKFKTVDSGDIAGCLAQLGYIVVQDPARRFDTEAARNLGYAHGGREMPIRSVRLTSLMTPVPSIPSDTEHFFPRDGDGNAIRFHLEAEDAAGQPLDFAIPMMFVSERAAQDADGARRIYQAAAADLRRTDLRGQPMAFAEPVNDNTRFTTFSLDLAVTTSAPGGFPAGESRFLPALAGAGVTIPALDELFPGSAMPAIRAITLHAAYLRDAFDAARNPGQAVVNLAPFDIDPPRAKSGALCAIPMRLDGISQRFGPVAAIDDIARGAFDPARIFQSVNAKLLGAIDLRDLLARIAPGGGGLEQQVPKLKRARLPDRVTTTLDWQPAVNRLQGIIETTSETSLSLHAESTLFFDGRDPVTDVSGKLARFKFSLLGLVAITFGEVAFRTQHGRRASLDAHGVKVEFLDKLSFVKSLGDVLPADGFKGARLAVDQDGVTASYTLGIPAAGAGAFSIENIALSAELFLPFGDKTTDLRLAFSSREHPFLVTFSMVGGGGFFAVVLNAQKVTLIEGAFEMGGNISFDFVIARANVHALAGFYFSLPTDAPMTLSAFVRVGGEIEVLGIVGVSVDVYVALSYSPSPGRLGVMRGEAGLTLAVHVLMFSKSITLALSCSFDIASGDIDVRSRSFARMLTTQNWVEYCGAYA